MEKVRQGVCGNAKQEEIFWSNGIAHVKFRIVESLNFKCDKPMNE